jgi:hypothetical protein
MFTINAKLNGNRKTFNSLESLQKEYKSYGDQLYSLTIEVHNGDKHWYLSLISAAYYLKEGILPDLDGGS